MYLPDITERFPEGVGEVDMTSRYFGEYDEYKYDDYEYDEDYEDD